jgi:5-formyltetrahydrofolate cyclo-ligase
MRARRRELLIKDRKRASNRFATIALRSSLLQASRRIALYIAHGGEADPAALLQRALRLGCEIYLPVITDHRLKQMRFARFDTDTALVRNRYGIPEPDPKHATFISARHLDCIFVPLVAVDSAGNRIGSGAGFYDRALKHLRSERRWRRPKLIGIAFECQQLPHIPAHPWDIPLDALLTEKSLSRFTSRTAPNKGPL